MKESDIQLHYLTAFVTGGALCVLAQLTLNLTELSPAHIMVLFVSLGAVVSGLDFYQPLIDFGGAGAAVPLTGFGHALVTGILDAVNQEGLLGLFTGGLTATAFGITVAVVFGYLISLLFSPKG